MSAMNIIIIGGGVNGISIARAIAAQSDNFSIKVIEKEKTLGAHSSTRNSGVIHAGFYYDTNSVRGKFCSDANKMLRDYCLAKNVPVNRCGKIVVTKNDNQELILQELYKRGKEKNVDLYMLSKDRLSEYEPLARTHSSFLWSPNTWSANPTKLSEQTYIRLQRKGVEFVTNTRVTKFENRKLITSNGDSINYDYLVNAAGGFSLKIAKEFDLGKKYLNLPFKGLYLKSNTKDKRFSKHIYPIPDARQTFLGVHTTLTHDGYLKLGPTAIPVLGPEHYSLFTHFNLDNLIETLPIYVSLFANNSFGFRNLAFREFKNVFKSEIIRSANELVTETLHAEDYNWYSPGIRAQLIDKNKWELVSDFVFEETVNSIHLLNTISPSWTCSLKTGDIVAKKIVNQLSGIEIENK